MRCQKEGVDAYLVEILSRGLKWPVALWSPARAVEAGSTAHLEIEGGRSVLVAKLHYPGVLNSRDDSVRKRGIRLPRARRRGTCHEALRRLMRGFFWTRQVF